MGIPTSVQKNPMKQFWVIENLFFSIFSHNIIYYSIYKVQDSIGYRKHDYNPIFPVNGIEQKRQTGK